MPTAPKHKIDALKRAITAIKGSEEFNQAERWAYFAGMRNACTILAGHDAGVTKLMTLVIEREPSQ